MWNSLQNGFAFEKSTLFGERIKHFGGGVIGGRVAYFVAVGNCD